MRGSSRWVNVEGRQQAGSPKDRGKPVSHYQRRMRASGLQNASGYTNPAPTKIQAPKFHSCKFLGFLGVTGCAATSQ